MCLSDCLVRYNSALILSRDLPTPEIRLTSRQAMTTPLKLHANPTNKNGFKARIAAEYAGVQLELVPVEMGKSNKTPQFLKLNPNGKVRWSRVVTPVVWASRLTFI